MKELYIECKMGAAGDMLMAALLQQVENQAGFLSLMQELFPEVSLTPHKVTQKGVSGLGIQVLIDDKEEISQDYHGGKDGAMLPARTATKPMSHPAGHDRINSLMLPTQVKMAALEIYGALAAAEAKAHGCLVEQIHFTRLGDMDAIVDIVGSCILIAEIGAERITASPIHVGRGQVKCRCGILNVPTPATAALLAGIPIYSGDIEGELCTPTGAAILTYFAAEFRWHDMEKEGFLSCTNGFGTKEYAVPSCVKVYLFES